MSPPAVPAQHQGMLRHNSSTGKNLSLLAAKIRQVNVRGEQPSTMDLSYLPPQSSSSLSSFSSSCEDDVCSLPLAARNWGGSHAAAGTSTFRFFNPWSAVASMFRSFLPALQSLLIPSCHLLAVAGPPVSTKGSLSRSRSIGRGKRLLTGTFFGQKKGRVSFAIQETPRSEPVLLLELATPTSHLVKEMASGMVRILLECNRNPATGGGTTTNSSGMMTKKALWDEPVWSMYCNGHKLGYATARECTASDLHVLSTVQTVSAGAGVMPATPPLLPPPPADAPPNSPKGAAKNDSSNDSSADCYHPEIMYMRAKFDRVIGSRDSEALYMISPDCRGNGDGGKFNSGGPEVSIFMLRI